MIRCKFFETTKDFDDWQLGDDSPAKIISISPAPLGTSIMHPERVLVVYKE